MRIIVNEKEIFLEGHENIELLLKKLDFQDKGIAVAKNNEVIPKSKWKQTLIEENDHLEIVQAVQGG